MTKRYSYFKSEITGLFVIVDELHKETFSGMEDEYNCSRIVRKLNTLSDENGQLKQSNKDAWDLIRFIYNEIKEDGSMDFGRIKDLVEFDGDVE